MNRIKTHQTWKKHATFKPRRLTTGYYDAYQNKRKQRLVRIIFLIAVILFLQSIFQMPWLRLHNIKVVNNKDISATDIQDFVLNKLNQSKFLIFSNNNYFLTNTKPVASELKDKYNLNSVVVKKHFPQTLEIILQEKISQFIWQKDGSLYLLDSRGALNRQIEALDNKYIVLDDVRGYKPGPGQDIFRTDEIDAIQAIVKAWNDTIATQAKLVKITIGDNWGDLRLKTDIGYTVKISASTDIKTQIDNLKRVLVAGNVQGTDVDYIDVRFADKVYFK